VSNAARTVISNSAEVQKHGTSAIRRSATQCNWTPHLIRHRGPLRIAGKDRRFYCRPAESVQAPSFVAQSASQLYQLANVRGHGERFMPTLPGILAELIGAPIRELP